MTTLNTTINAVVANAGAKLMHVAVAASLAAGAILSGPFLGAGTTAQAAGTPDVMVGYLVGPTSLSANQTQVFRTRVQGAGSAAAEGVRFDLTSSGLPMNFQSIVITQDNVQGGSHFACAITDATGPSAKAVCKGGRIEPHSYVTVELHTRITAISGHGQGGVAIKIDPLNTIAESNESNNAYTFNVTY